MIRQLGQQQPPLQQQQQQLIQQQPLQQPLLPQQQQQQQQQPNIIRPQLPNSVPGLSRGLFLFFCLSVCLSNNANISEQHSENNAVYKVIFKFTLSKKDVFCLSIIKHLSVAIWLNLQANQSEKGNL